MISLMLSGGVVLWLIIMVGLAATFIFFIRYFDLRRAHVDYADFMAGVENLIEKGNDREAIAICEETMVPVAKVVAAALRRRGERSDQVRETAEIAARGEILPQAFCPADGCADIASAWPFRNSGWVRKGPYGRWWKNTRNTA